MTLDNKPTEFHFAGYKLDVGQRRLYTLDIHEINISSRAFDTLLTLLQHRGEILTKIELMKAVWPNSIVEENNLNQAISSLRKALGDSKKESRFIQTVPGRGYCFIAELDSAIQSVAPSNQTFNSLGTSSFFKKIRSFNYSPYFLIFIFFTLILSSIYYFGHNKDITEQASLDSNTLPNSIAILPFNNLNPEADNALFTLALHDEVINQLSKIQSLNVISRDSIMFLSEQHKSIQELGRRLNVESVMTGTIILVDGRARVSLQMLEPGTGVTLWAATYDADTRNLNDMISIQSDIATNVALALEAEINQQEKLIVEAIPTESFEAYRYNLAARNAYYTQDFEKTWSLTKLALELDPNYLDALYNFSYVNTVLTAIPLQGMSSLQHFQLALESAEKIISIAPDSSEGYSLRASALGTNKQWGLVAEEVERLKEMGVPPADMKFHAIILLCLGDFKGAIEILKANLMIEPVNLYGRGFLIAAYELTGDREQARQDYKIGKELNPVWWGDTVNIFLSLGRNEPLKNIDNLIGISTELRDLLHNLDDTSRVQSSLKEFLNSDGKISAETVYYSAIAAYIGENELAIKLMKFALEDVWLSFHWLWLPVFDDTRKLDNFKQLLVDSGIVDYWQQYGWSEVCQPTEESFSCEWRAYP